MGPTFYCRAVQVSLLVQDQPAKWILPVYAVVLRAKADDERLLAFGSDFEYDTAVEVPEPAVGSGPIQVSLLVQH